jgi:hypothetical protein
MNVDGMLSDEALRKKFHEHFVVLPASYAFLLRTAIAGPELIFHLLYDWIV